MKKLLLLFAVMLSAVGAWAQGDLPFNKACTVIAEGHNSGAKPGWAINNEKTAMVSFGNTAIADEAQKNFAFIQFNGKVYLYSVWAEKFVNKDMSLTNALPVDDIKVESVDGGKFFFKYDDSHNMNIGGSKQLAPDGWTTKDGGNQYTITEVDMDFDPSAALAILDNPTAELQALIGNAEALLATVNANIGTVIGKYTQSTANALAAAINTAKGIGNATAADIATLQAAINAVKVILPTVGQYYQIHSALAAFPETKAVYSNGSAPRWKTLNNDDKSFYWLAVDAGNGNVVFQNANDGKYIAGNAAKSGAWTMVETPSKESYIDVKIFSEGEAGNDIDNEYGIIMNNWQMHCNGHVEGAGTESNIVSWNTDNANSASSWFIKPVELQMFYDVTYNFIYNDEVKYTSTVSIASGAEYPEVMVPVMPYGINAGEVARPEGTVTENKVVNFELTKEKEFTSVKTVVDAANIDTWYYVQMHANGLVTSYIEDNGGSTVEWTDKTVAQADIESHLWGFVGDVFGMKMVNKKTGKAIASTGSGNASMSDVNSATSFVVTASQANDPWFCFKYPTNNNYLNAQGDCIKHWADNDNGSSFKATEYKIHEVEVGTAGYATLYLGSKVFIPETVEAYVVSEATGNYASLTQVTGSLPANTGVILKGEGTHQFITSADAATTIESNLLAGSVENTYVAGPAYVLANGTNGVGLYKAALNKDAEGAVGTTHFLNSANKAYLPATTAAEARFLVFNFGDDNATAIEGIEAESTANAVVYDLAGRRVQKAQKGLYIVNGKKVIK